VTFTVDTAHNATWTLGATTTSPPVAFGTPTVRVRLSATYAAGSAAAPELFFGNLIETTP